MAQGRRVAGFETRRHLVAFSTENRWPPFLKILSELALAMRFFVAATLAVFAIPTAAHASTTCAVVGDSIADELRGFFRECRIDAKIGIGTAAIAPRVPRGADLIVVSAGSNDYSTPGLLGRLQALRSRAGSARVIWIRPAPAAAAAAVDTVAHAHGDAVVPFAVSRTDREHIHPQSSQRLAADIRRLF
jgi:hypothetical protein